jgi:hypothetical protein
LNFLKFCYEASVQEFIFAKNVGEYNKPL